MKELGKTASVALAEENKGNHTQKGGRSFFKEMHEAIKFSAYIATSIGLGMLTHDPKVALAATGLSVAAIIGESFYDFCKEGNNNTPTECNKVSNNAVNEVLAAKKVNSI